jgi:hypothetical protein
MSKHITLPFYCSKERPAVICVYFRRKEHIPIVVLPVLVAYNQAQFYEC